MSKKNGKKVESYMSLDSLYEKNNFRVCVELIDYKKAEKYLIGNTCNR